MKLLTTTVLLLALAVMPAQVLAARADIPSENLTESQPESVVEVEDAASGASVLDLSLFGIITLGVLGLFWIRRHTSQL